MFVTKYIDHQLQQRDIYPTGALSPWRSCDAGMYDGSRCLAYSGRIFEALQAVQAERIENYGHCCDVEYRVLTRETSVATIGNPVAMKPEAVEMGS